MIDIGIMIYTDTTITRDIILDIRYYIKREILSFIEELEYGYQCEKPDDDGIPNVSIYLDACIDIREELIDMLRSVFNQVMPVSVNKDTIPKHDTGIQRLKSTIDAMGHQVFKHKHPLVLYISGETSYSIGTPDSIIDTHIHQMVDEKVLNLFEIDGGLGLDHLLGNICIKIKFNGHGQGIFPYVLHYNYNPEFCKSEPTKRLFVYMKHDTVRMNFICLKSEESNIQ